MHILEFSLAQAAVQLVHSDQSANWQSWFGVHSTPALQALCSIALRMSSALFERDFQTVEAAVAPTAGSDLGVTAELHLRHKGAKSKSMPAMPENSVLARVC